MTKNTRTRPEEAASQKISKPPNIPLEGPPTLTIDWDLYGQYLEDSDLSDVEKQEFIEVLWSLVVSFVDLGLGLHPAQLVAGSGCEQNGGKTVPDSGSVIGLPHTTQTEFMASARQKSGPAQQRRSPE